MGTRQRMLNWAAAGAQSCGCPGYVVLCSRVTSPLTAALPPQDPGQEKRGMADSSQQRPGKGKQGQAVPAPRSFSRAQAWHAQWS